MFRKGIMKKRQSKGLTEILKRGDAIVIEDNDGLSSELKLPPGKIEDTALIKPVFEFNSPGGQVEDTSLLKLESISLQVFRVKEIQDEKTYLKFGEWVHDAELAKAQRFDFFEPMRKKTHDSYKEVKSNQNKAVLPFEELIKNIKSKRSKYYIKSELERQEREEQIRADREAEARKIADIEAAKRKEVEDQGRKAKSKVAKEKAEAARIKFEEEKAKQDSVLADLPPVEINSLDDNKDRFTKIKDFDIHIMDDKALLTAIVKGKIPGHCVEVKLNKVKQWVNATGADLADYPFIKKIPKVIERKKTGGW
jgi:hypothetical protein